jgi:hypothetical protein
VHLRYPESFADLGLRHVFEESKPQNALLAFRQRRQERANRFDVEHLVQVAVQISEAATDRSSIVVVVACAGGGGGVRRERE